MNNAQFIHLRVHSAYTLSNGAIPINALIDLCKKFNMPAVAITDSNNLFGALEFSQVAKKEGIQPIIGCKLHIDYNNELESNEIPKFAKIQKQSPAPMVFLVKNQIGYQNLLKLISYAYLENVDPNVPQVPIGLLEDLNEGLIALSGGPDGPLGQLIINEQRDFAKNLLKRLMSIFSDNLYMEILRHGLNKENITEESFLRFAYDFNIPLVATNEAYFVNRDMYEAHDALICIEEKTYVSQTSRRRETPEHYFKNASEMNKLFNDLPEAIQNTITVAKRCAFLINTIPPILPPFDCGDNRTEQDELKELAKNGLDGRLKVKTINEQFTPEQLKKIQLPYETRLNFELEIIIQMGFAGYFLIVADIIRWARVNNIPVGPGRGSGAGSLVAWALTITDLDPLKWGLLFERFLNPERVSMPDFDIDFCQERRDEIIKYVQEKYGRDRVAQIITFGKLQSRAVLRDVGRVLEIPYGYVDKICKLIPNNPAAPTSLTEAISKEPSLKKIIENDDSIQKLIEIALPLEGLYRHASTHAAGVVIGDRPLNQLIPLYRDQKSDIAVTGFSMKYVEAAGLIKFDFLGLKTLTVIATALTLIHESGNHLTLDSIQLNNKLTFKLMEKGETTGVFQLESSGMRDVLKNLKPDTFEDIIAVVALYRPGPMDNIPSYIKRKHGNEKVSYLHPSLESVLKETYGIMIYQEQVMQIAQILSGYSLSGADLLRRAMGKKIKKEMDQQRRFFIEGAKKNGIAEKKSEEIFEQVNKFAGYGFNKSHAAAYALIAYQTAYLKANFPIEFFAASMTLDANNTDKLNIFCSELRRMNINLLPPDINKSRATFSVECDNQRDDKNKSIRYALTAIRNVGQAAIQSIVDERDQNGPYKTIDDFINRLDSSNLNKRQLEGLIKAGALDCLNKNRKQLYQSVESIIKHASLAYEDKQSSQIKLFNDNSRPENSLRLPNISNWNAGEQLQEEYDSIGFYLSAHPLDLFKHILTTMNVYTIAQINENKVNGTIQIAATILTIKERVSAKGNKYAFIQCSDTSGIFEITVFGDTLSKHREVVQEGRSVIIEANIDFQDPQNELKILAKSFSPLKEDIVNRIETLRIFIKDDAPLVPLREILQNEKMGNSNIEIIPKQDGYEGLALKLNIKYDISAKVGQAIKTLPGVIEVQEIR